MTIKTTPPRFGQKGFTLIEIVMVLVLLGILAAVVVPKYFDLQEEAEKQAVHAIAAEYQAQVNAVFADEILKGHSCEDAAYVAGIEQGMVFEKENKGKGFEIWTSGYDDSDKNYTSYDLFVNLNPTPGWRDNLADLTPIKIYVPACNGRN